jgi:hypothetical protein
MPTSDNPTITLILKGLFILAFEEENKFCQAAVMRAEGHCLKINTNTNETSQLIFPQPTLEIPDGDIYFQVTGRESGVSIYEQPGPFDRNTAQDRRDFRWIVDLEGSEFYSRSLPFKAGAIKRSIFINNGLFYTYSARPVLIISPLSGQRHARVAEQIGCDIYLDDQEEAVIRYGPDLAPSIRLRKMDGVSYTITLENICEEPHEATPNNSDFAFYYDVIDVPMSAQFMVTSQTADARNPCDPITVGLTKAPLS